MTRSRCELRSPVSPRSRHHSAAFHWPSTVSRNVKRSFSYSSSSGDCEMWSLTWDLSSVRLAPSSILTMYFFAAIPWGWRACLARGRRFRARRCRRADRSLIASPGAARRRRLAIRWFACVVLRFKDKGGSYNRRRHGEIRCRPWNQVYSIGEERPKVVCRFFRLDQSPIIGGEASDIPRLRVVASEVEPVPF